MSRSLLLIFLLLTLVGCDDSNVSAPGAAGSGSATGKPAPRSKLPTKIEPFKPLLTEGDAAEVDAMTTTSSGLMFKVVKNGSGEMPPMGAQILVHQTVWIIRDGRLSRRIIDSRAELKPDRMLLAKNTPSASVIGAQRHPLAPRPPQPVGLNAWLEALQDMRPGERRWIIAPSQLAWGPLGYPEGGVDPDTNIAVDIELVSFRPPAP
jgi:hypothetical protein